MSEETLAVARRFVAAWNDRDVKAWLADLHPEAEWLPAAPLYGGDGNPYWGKGGMRQFWLEYRNFWDFELDIHELHEVEDAVVVVWGFRRAAGKSTTIKGWPAPVREDAPSGAWLLEFDGGLLRRVRAYNRYRAALRAVGLRD